MDSRRTLASGGRGGGGSSSGVGGWTNGNSNGNSGGGGGGGGGGGNGTTRTFLAAAERLGELHAAALAERSAAAAMRSELEMSRAKCKSLAEESSLLRDALSDRALGAGGRSGSVGDGR